VSRSIAELARSASRAADDGPGSANGTAHAVALASS